MTLSSYSSCLFVCWFFFFVFFFFFFKQKTAYEMRISDWSSDVCSSDLPDFLAARFGGNFARFLSIIVLLCCSFTYVVAQVYATGKIGRASCRERVCQYV